MGEARRDPKRVLGFPPNQIVEPGRAQTLPENPSTQIFKEDPLFLFGEVKIAKGPPGMRGENCETNFNPKLKFLGVRAFQMELTCQIDL